MAGPTDGGFNVTTTAANTMTASVSSVGGETAADQIMLVLHVDNLSGGVTWPSGFAEIAQFANATNNETSVAVKTATASEPANYAPTWINAQHSVLSVHLVSGSDGVDAVSATADLGSAVDLSSNTVTTSVADTLAYAIVGLNRNNIAIDDANEPTGYTMKYLRGTSGTGNCAGGVSHKAFASAGATGDAVWTGAQSSTSQWVGFHVAFKAPAGAAPTTFPAAGIVGL